MKRIVPDTSVLIDGHLMQLVKNGDLQDSEIIIPRVVLDELQAQASTGRYIGMKGLEELKALRESSASQRITITMKGERPSLEEIRLAKKGRLDALIRDASREADAKLLTSDFIQALVGQAEGLDVQYIPPKGAVLAARIEDYFTPDIMSVHLKEDVPPQAKRGKPGEWKLVSLRDNPCTIDELDSIYRSIMQQIHTRHDSFVEIWRKGAVIVQMGEFRIAIAKPPFSDGFEITAVRPLAKVTLSDYTLSEKLKERFVVRAEGILICGPPGAGKSTFASALAEFYRSSRDAIVKTMESPRDLQVPPEITQYSPLEGDFRKTADILLLVRPDYIIFDELRKTMDFHVFADMRLAGVGMVGVVHSTDAISAVQRFIGRIELGMIPHIVDTVIFIKDGKIERVYILELTVKVPKGMVEADLARPLIEVKDFETGRVEYEIYTYGEENVVIPMARAEAKSPMQALAGRAILDEVFRYDQQAQVEVVSDTLAKVKLNPENIPYLIGREGKNITRLERKLGLRIDVQPLEEQERRVDLPFQVTESSAYIVFNFEKPHAHEKVQVYLNEGFLLSAIIDKKARLKFSRSSDVGEKIAEALKQGSQIRVVV